MVNFPTTYSILGSRKEQEDRFYVHPILSKGTAPTGYILAVLDGHNGAEAADAALAKIVQGVKALERTVSLPALQKEQVLRALFEGLSLKTHNFFSGTTLVLALVDLVANVVSFLNIGDSVGAVVRRQKIVYLTTPHNSRTNKKDRDALIKSGAYYHASQGYFVNVDGAGIQLTRTLGDADFPFLLREPEISHQQLTENDFILLASDGVIPTHSAERAKVSIEIIRKHLRKPGPTAQSLIETVLEPGAYQDNATAILFQL